MVNRIGVLVRFLGIVGGDRFRINFPGGRIDCDVHELRKIYKTAFRRHVEMRTI